MDAMATNWRIAVVGAGAIGGNLAWPLALAGENVTLIDAWPEHVQAVRDNGLRVSGVRGEHRVQLPALHIGEALQLEDQVDLLIVAVKSYDTAWVATLTAPLLRAGGFVLSAQNGLNEETLAAHLGFG